MLQQEESWPVLINSLIFISFCFADPSKSDCIPFKCRFAYSLLIPAYDARSPCNCVCPTVSRV